MDSISGKLIVYQEKEATNLNDCDINLENDKFHNEVLWESEREYFWVGRIQEGRGLVSSVSLEGWAGFGPGCREGVGRTEASQTQKWHEVQAIAFVSKIAREDCGQGAGQGQGLRGPPNT